MNYSEEEHRLVQTYVDYVVDYCEGEWHSDTRGDWFCKYCDTQEEVNNSLDLFDELYNSDNEECGVIK